MELLTGYAYAQIFAPKDKNYVALEPEKRDAWGIPVLHIHASYGENEHAMATAMRQDVLEILDAMKLDHPRPPDRLSAHPAILLSSPGAILTCG